MIKEQLQNPEPIKFSYSTDAYDPYIKEGFNPPLENKRTDFIERFPKQCKYPYGKVKVKILAMARQKAIDWSTKSHERKEYLTFN